MRKIVTDEERERRSDSVLRCIRENPGQSAQALGRRLGWVTARQVRERIRRLRARGVAIVIGPDGTGYLYLPDVADAKTRADLVRGHLWRTREYLGDHARLMKQIGGMTADAVAESMLFDLTVPMEESERLERTLLGPEDLAQIPVARRAGLTRVLCRILDRFAADPEAFAAERAVLGDKYGKVFLTTAERDKLRAAKKALAEIEV